MIMRHLIPGLAVLFLSALPAQAGFDWTPAPAPVPEAGIQATGEPLMPDMPAMPSAQVDIIDVESSPLARSRPPLMTETATFQAAPPPGMSASAMVAPVNTFPARAPLPSDAVFAEAVGFGSDMPLVLALRQVVPPRYAFAFDPAVDQGARVDWNGGKPWNMVLDDALKPLGLGAQISETTVRILPVAYIAAPLTYGDETVRPAPMDIVPQIHPRVEKQKLQEIYIRRKGQTSQLDDSSNAMNETLSPAAGGPDISAEKKPFWSRLGLSASRGPGSVSSPEPSPAPLLASEDNGTGMQPVSLTGESAMQNSGALMKTEKQQGVMDPYDVHFWQAEKGDSLKNVLATWSDSAGVELYWTSTEDYILPQAVRMHGNYTDAVTNVLSIYGEAAQRPQGRLHPNLPTGPSVLIIESAQN